MSKPRSGVEVKLAAEREHDIYVGTKQRLHWEKLAHMNQNEIRTASVWAGQASNTALRELPVREVKKYFPHKHDENPQQHLHVRHLNTYGAVKFD